MPVVPVRRQNCFSTPIPGGSIKNMRALNGERYKNIANAFKYRKEYVADCRCKVDPWSLSRPSNAMKVSHWRGKSGWNR